MANDSVKKAGRTDAYTQEQMAEAIAKAGGVLTDAATLLGCSRQTVSGYVRRYPHLQQVVYDSKDEMLDIAESQLLAKLKSGNMAAIIFTLKCQGKHRGWVEKGESVPPPTPLPVGANLDNLSDSQLEQLDGLLSSAVDTAKPN